MAKSKWTSAFLTVLAASALSLGMSPLAKADDEAGPPPNENLCSNTGEENLRKVPAGFSCQTSKGVVFQLLERTKKGKEIWKDTQSGILVSDTIDGTFNFREAQTVCSEKRSASVRGSQSRVTWSLPSGYPRWLNGKSGFKTPKMLTRELTFPDQNSDFATLEADGFREVVPNTKDRKFWSSSRNPYDRYVAFFLNGRTGVIGYYWLSNFYSVRCIGR